MLILALTALDSLVSLLRALSSKSQARICNSKEGRELHIACLTPVGPLVDKVATRLIERLQATLGETVPDGTTVLLTITAPIRMPSKTAASLEDKIQTLLGRGSPSRDEKDAIHGNRVQIRLLRDESDRAPKMIGFVHNSDSYPLLLLEHDT